MINFFHECVLPSTKEKIAIVELALSLSFFLELILVLVKLRLSIYILPLGLAPVFGQYFRAGARLLPLDPFSASYFSLFWHLSPTSSAEKHV